MILLNQYKVFFHAHLIVPNMMQHPQHDILAVPRHHEAPWDLRSLILCLLALLCLGLAGQPQALHRPDVPEEAAGYFSRQQQPVSSFPFFHRPLPVNQVDAAALDLIPGIGPRLAEAIVLRREEMGHIAAMEDLGNIRGLGGRQRDTLRQWLLFE